MPKWDKELECYIEESTDENLDANRVEREERFRVALLNELSCISEAIKALDAGEGFKVSQS